MRQNKKAIVFLFALFSLMIRDSRGPASLAAAAVPDAASQRRIRFQIRAIEQKRSERTVISEALIEGPPGIDFNVTLGGSRVGVKAEFLTDLIEPGMLQVRARLESRHLYGQSNRGLPLYEEDIQAQTLAVGFDESIILLPFGGANEDDNLKIEITPGISDETMNSPSGQPRPLRIDILKPAPGGVINIEAFKRPHRFVVEAALLEDGKEIATRTADVLLKDPQELVLHPVAGGARDFPSDPVSIVLGIDRFLPGRLADEVGINFDVHRLTVGGDRREPIALRWAGVGRLGSEMAYDISKNYLPSSGKEYRLRFRVKLAPGERAD